MDDTTTLAQGAVERLLENEALRGDLTDSGFLPVTDWATNALLAAARGANQEAVEGAQSRMDEAESAVKRLVGAVVQAAQRHSRADVVALLQDPTVARDRMARFRVAANGWRLGDDADANAIRLIKALRGVEV